MYDIYSNSKDNAFRFSLGKEGKRKLFIIGLNPSTATREKSDITIAKVERVAKLNEYDGFAMLNLYPVRATDYRALSSNKDSEAYYENLNLIERLISSETHAVIWAAWGQGILKRAYFVDAFSELVKRLTPHQACWKHFGSLTQRGHPRHPSRLSYSWSFSLFDVICYARLLNA
jgi:hypothetical protein